MKTISPLIIAGLLLLGSLPTTQAQEQPPVYNIEFYAMGWSGAITGLSYGSSPEDLQPFLASMSRPSGPYHYSGTSPLRFGKMETDTEGNPLFTAAAELVLDSSPHQPLFLLFLPATKSVTPQDTYRLVALPDIIRNEPGSGEVSFINLTNKQLIGILNNARFAIPPGGHTNVKAVPEKNNTLVLRLAQRGKDEAEWRLGYSTLWAEREHNQSVIFIIPHPDSDERIMVKRVLVNHLSRRSNSPALQATPISGFASSEYLYKNPQPTRIRSPYGLPAPEPQPQQK